jgi:hypothetical protein
MSARTLPSSALSWTLCIAQMLNNPIICIAAAGTCAPTLPSLALSWTSATAAARAAACQCSPSQRSPCTGRRQCRCAKLSSLCQLQNALAAVSQPFATTHR